MSDIIFENSESIFVMGSDPVPDRNTEDIWNIYYQNCCEATLALAFALADNKFWWVEDDEYDYEEGSPEYKKACAITNEWGDLMDKLKDEIFSTLMQEGIAIPEKGQNKALIAFMERNGYCNRNGWWCKNK